MSRIITNNGTDRTVVPIKPDVSDLVNQLNAELNGVATEMVVEKSTPSTAEYLSGVSETDQREGLLSQSVVTVCGVEPKVARDALTKSGYKPSGNPSSSRWYLPEHRPAKDAPKDIAAFFNDVLPSADVEGDFIGAMQNKGKKGLNNFSADTTTELAEYCDAKKGSANVFMALAKFKTHKTHSGGVGRQAKYATSLKSLFADLDCGESKDYKNQKAAIEHVYHLVEEKKLPRPTYYVKSGSGIHLYWVLNDAITAKVWKPVADELKKYFGKIGLKADPAVTADVAQVLRPIHTINHKDPKNPITVKLLGKKGPTYDLVDIKPLVGGAGDNFCEGSGLSDDGEEHFGDGSELSGGVEYRDVTRHAATILDNCPVMAEALEKGGKGCSEPLWSGQVNLLAFCDDGKDYVHKISVEHEGYTEGATIKKFDSKVEAKANDGSGPTLCKTFEEFKPELCKGCKLRGLIKTPLHAVDDQQRARELEAKRILSESEALEFFNSCYAVAKWGNEIHIVDTTGKELVRRKLSQFTLDTETRLVAVKNKNDEFVYKPVGKWWRENFNRKQYKEVIFDPANTPGETSGGRYNNWTGFGVIAAKGDWSLLREHIHYVLCKEDKQISEYVFNWLAYLVQYPGNPHGTALILRESKGGAGKGIVMEWFETIFGIHSILISSKDELVGDFNRHLENKVFVAADEPAYAGDHAAINKLKSMITRKTCSIQPKGVDSYQTPNVLSLIISTNEDWVINVKGNERRWTILEVDTARAQDETYFDPLVAQAEGGGIEAMLYDLLKRDLSEFNPRKAIRTKGLIKQRLHSGDGFDEMLVAMLDADSATPHGQLDRSYNYALGSEVPVPVLYREYEAICNRRRSGQAINRIAFSMRLAKELGGKVVRRMVDGKQGKVFAMPDSKTLEKILLLRLQ